MTRLTAPNRSLIRGIAPGPRDIIVWPGDRGRIQSRTADRPLTDFHPDQFRPIRTPKKYPRQRNYHGYYWVAGSVRRLVWHESMTEFTALMWLDHTERVAAIEAQPFSIGFATEGSTAEHIPDYFAVLEDGRRLLLDVRPRGFLDDAAAEQFERTAALCATVGWEYRRFHGLDHRTVQNLEWIAAYRHPRYAPTPEERELLLEMASEVTTFDAARYALDTAFPARRVHGLYHLLWTRELEFEISAPLTEATKIWSATK